MKIKTPDASFIDEKSAIASLKALLKQPGINQLRACQHCNIACQCSNSSHCACQCSAECSNIPTAISTEPALYPIEPGVAKLVFELNSLRLFETCWSCEGHQDNYGDVNKLPRIWFYTQSPVYAQLAVIHLTNLSCRHKTTHRWVIQMLSLNENFHPTYSMEPILEHTTQPNIDALQQDLKIISQNFAQHIKTIAREQLQKLEQALTTHLIGQTNTKLKLAQNLQSPM